MDNTPTFEIVDGTAGDREWIRALVSQPWGGEIVVAHGTTYYPHELPSLLAVSRASERLGLLTYCIDDHALEVVTLDSLVEGRGVGTALLAAAMERALAHDCRKVWLITTNDNLHALRFYQRRGYRLVAVHPNALAATRRLKPSLPELGMDGIPLRDELELEHPLVSA